MSTQKRKKFGPFASRLREARTEANLTQEDVARKLDVTTHTYQNWERDISLPRVDIITKLSRLFDVSLEWLLTGRNIGEIQEITGEGPTLPILGDIACDFEGITNEVLDIAPRIGVDPTWIYRGARYLVNAHGESMAGARIHDGDIVALAPVKLEEIVYNSKTVYAIFAWRDQACLGCMLKYLHEYEGTVVAVPAHPDYQPQALAELGTKVEVFAKVVGVSRSFD